MFGRRCFSELRFRAKSGDAQFFAHVSTMSKMHIFGFGDARFTVVRYLRKLWEHWLIGDFFVENLHCFTVRL